MPDSNPFESEDSGLHCLVLVARFHGLAADAFQINHFRGNTAVPHDTDDLVRAGRRLGLKARAIQSDWKRLAGTPLPAIYRGRDGQYGLLARADETRVLVQTPEGGPPKTLTRDEFVETWSGELLLLSRRARSTAGDGRFGFSWFIPAIRKHRALFFEILLASFFLQLFALITPLFFQVVVDKVLVHRGVSTLDVLALGLLVVSVFEVVLSGLRTYVFSHTTNRIDVMLGARLFGHLLRLPMGYFEARRVGDSVARVKELENIREFLTGSSVTLAIDVFFTLVFFVVLYLYSPLLTGIVAAGIPVYIVLSLVITPILRSRLEEKFNRGAENQAFLVESVNGIQTLKSMSVEPQMQTKWEEQLAAYVGASFKASNLGNIASQVAGLVNKVTVVAVLWVGASLVMSGKLSVGQLIAFNMIAGRVSGPILRLVQLWQDFQQAGISIKRLGDILNAPVEPGHGNGRASCSRIEGAIRFDRVGFRYGAQSRPALQDVSFEIAPGEVIGIVGRSGSGKSTLTKLIQRLYVPEQGRISIDGADLSAIDPNWLRRQTGVVLQENFLFNRSVRDNIALSDPALPLPRIIAAASLSGAHEFVSELPEGYDTLIGEHGANLSGGQRQRIAIARALVSDPAILIFDEATSALDYESEQVIQQNMQDICRGRTVFIIAHRLSAVRGADRILVIDQGQVVEQGDHDELLAQRGIYARLHSLQSGPGGDGRNPLRGRRPGGVPHSIGGGYA